MSSGLRLEKTTPNTDWDSFVNNSENGTIFSLGGYLESLEGRRACYYCFNNSELRAAVAVMESKNGESAVLHDSVIYNGVMFGPPTNNQNHAQRLSEQFKISEFIAGELANIYRNVAVSLHPSVCDIRPFLWINYGTDLPKYQADVRYTSYIDISDFRTAESLDDISTYVKSSVSRRQQVRYAIKKGVRTVEEVAADLCVGFYEKTMSRQKIEVAAEKLSEMRTMITSLREKKLGRMFVSYNEHNEPGSVAFIGVDSKRAYYIWGANDPDMRDDHTGTAVLWDAFHALSKDGVDEIDMEGINSPRRGWFKLSFGGNIAPYYELRLIGSGKGEE